MPFLIALCLLFLIALCDVGTRDYLNGLAPPQKPHSAHIAFTAEITAINLQRIAENTNALTADGRLECAAKMLAVELKEKGDCHEDPQSIARKADACAFPFYGGSHFIYCGVSYPAFLKELFNNDASRLALFDPQFRSIGISRHNSFYVVVLSKA